MSDKTFQLVMLVLVVLGAFTLCYGLISGVRIGMEKVTETQAYVDEHCRLKRIGLSPDGRIGSYACLHGNQWITEEFIVDRKGRIK